MKKTRVIAAALMAAVISAGAGYAAWTDTLNIGTTANTGKMNVEFITGQKFFGLVKYPSWAELQQRNHDHLVSDLDQTSKTVTVTLNDLYPGSGLLYSLGFENNGSIPVKIDNVEVKIDNTNFANDMKKELVVLGGYAQWRKGFAGDIVPVAGDVFLPNLSDIEKGKYHLEDLQDILNQKLAGKTMEVGDVITLDIPDGNDSNGKNYKDQIAALVEKEGIEGFNKDEQNCIIMGLPKRADEDMSLMSKDLTTDQRLDKSFSFTIKINFKQFNK